MYSLPVSWAFLPLLSTPQETVKSDALNRQRPSVIDFIFFINLLNVVFKVLIINCLLALGCFFTF